MDGYVKMIKEVVEVSLLGISLIKESLTAIAPAELSHALRYLWDGMVGLGNWMGYALAAAYYIGEDFGMGETVCEILGYGYYIVDGLHVLVSFVDDGSAESEEPSTLPVISEGANILD